MARKILLAFAAAASLVSFAAVHATTVTSDILTGLVNGVPFATVTASDMQIASVTVETNFQVCDSQGGCIPSPFPLPVLVYPGHFNLNNSALPIAFTEPDGTISDIVGVCFPCAGASPDNDGIFFISDPFEGVPTGPFSAIIPETGLPQDITSFLYDPGAIAAGGSATFQSDVSDPILTPLPAALPLFATGLGALGLLGWRRKKKAAA
jgi:hypothetical protein